jgi:integrase
MLAAMLRLIDFTVDDVPRADRLKEHVQAGLYPRPPGSRSWNVVPRAVGGSRRVQRRRPVLSRADILKMVAAAPVASPYEETVARDQAIVALACWSGISPYELPTLRWEQLLWRESILEAPWCATIHDVARRRRLVCIPVAEDAASYLRKLAEASTVGQDPPTGCMFRRSRGKKHPLAYSMTRRIVRLAVQNAGLPACDDTTLKRAYVIYLKQRGLNDYAIRDALGLRSMAPLEGSLRQYRWLTAQRIAAEHHVIKLPGPPGEESTALQLSLDAGLGDAQ